MDFSYQMVGERLVRGGRLASTRTSEAFEAVDQETGERVTLWLLRYPLVFGSEIALQFSARLQLLSDAQVSRIPFRFWGVDARGTAFLVTDFARGANLLGHPFSIPDLQNTFVNLVDSIARVHEHGQVLSDICNESFFLEAAGKPILWSMLGPFESGAKQTAALPPTETLHFVAPEQRNLSANDPTVDIFALGVLGYRLFTGRFPLAGRQLTADHIPDVTAVAPAPTTVRTDLPVWTDDILGNCLAARPSERFPDARELLKALHSAIEHGSSIYGNTRWSRKTVAVRSPALEENQQKEVSTYIAPQTKSMPTSYRPQPQRGRPVDIDDKRVRFITWSVALVVGLLVAGLLFLAIDRVNRPPQQASTLTDVINAAPAELKPLLVDATSAGLPFEKREKAIERIAQSQQGSAYSVLLRLRTAGLESNLVRSLDKFLFQRLTNDRQSRVAELLRRFWSEGGGARVTPEVFNKLLLACDRSLSTETRKKTLEEAVAVDPERTTQLVAALALDESEATFVPILRSFVGQKAGQTEVAGRGIGALILATNHLARSFQKDLPDWLQRISDEDLRWSLVHLAEHENRTVFDLAREMARRKALPPYQAIVLDAVIQLEKGPQDVPLQSALVRSALNGWDLDALQVVGQWMAPGAERVLLSAMATSSSPEVATKAFEIVAGRSLQNEPGKTFIGWVKNQLWDSRSRLVKPLGIISLEEMANDDELSYALDQFLTESSPGMLYRFSRSSGDTRILGIILKRFGERLPSQEVLDLLDSPSRDIRLEVVKALRGRNELVVLQRILRSYDREEDPEIRRAYEENHWVTKERSNRG